MEVVNLPTRREKMNTLSWHSAIRRYVVIATGLNLLWESVQVPLYTIWRTGSMQDIVFAVLHCTAGDVVIAITALVFTLVLLGSRDWPTHQSLPFNVLVIGAGLTYTVISERVNLANGAWAYSDLMPLVPWLNVGWSPVVQWIAIPAISLWHINSICASFHRLNDKLDK